MKDRKASPPRRDPRVRLPHEEDLPLEPKKRRRRVVPDDIRCDYIFDSGNEEWPHDRQGEQCEYRALPGQQRCGKHGGKLGRMAAMVATMPQRYQDLISGKLSPEDLSWEELQKGRIANEHGAVTGPGSQLIPRAMYEIMSRELVRRAESHFRENVGDMLEIQLEMARNPRTPARERLAATQYVMERSIGKIPDKQSVEVEVRKFEEMASGAKILIDIEPEYEVEAEIVDDEEDDL